MSKKSGRRHASATAAPPAQPSNPLPYDEPEVPLARPPVQALKPNKTLLEIAAERQKRLDPNTKFDLSLLRDSSKIVNVTVNPDGSVSTLDGSPLPAGIGSHVDGSGMVSGSKSVNDGVDRNGRGSGIGADEDLVPPILDTLLLAVSLSFLHFTLAALTYHQYAEELPWSSIAKDTLILTFPLLLLLIHFSRGHIPPLPRLYSAYVTTKQRRIVLSWAKAAAWTVIANAAGSYLVYVTNTKGYLAVMKNAPAVGTVWVLAVVELGVVGAVLGVAGPGIYAWWRGYGIYS